MRRLLRDLTTKLASVCCNAIRTHCDTSFKLVSNKHYFLNVSIKPLLLDFSPLLLLRISSVLIEEHPAYTNKQQEIYPTDSKSKFYWFLIFIFCHSLLTLSLRTQFSQHLPKGPQGDRMRGMESGTRVPRYHHSQGLPKMRSPYPES